MRVSSLLHLSNGKPRVEGDEARRSSALQVTCQSLAAARDGRGMFWATVLGSTVGTLLTVTPLWSTSNTQRAPVRVVPFGSSPWSSGLGALLRAPAPLLPPAAAGAVAAAGPRELRPAGSSSARPEPLREKRGGGKSPAPLQPGPSPGPAPPQPGPGPAPARALPRSRPGPAPPQPGPSLAPDPALPRPSRSRVPAAPGSPRHTLRAATSRSNALLKCPWNCEPGKPLDGWGSAKGAAQTGCRDPFLQPFPAPTGRSPGQPGLT